MTLTRGTGTATTRPCTRAATARSAVAAGLTALALAAPALCAAGPTIVIGQSLPSSGAESVRGGRVSSGVRAYIERINAAGGVNGRQVEVITLDDRDDPVLHAQNLRTLVQQNKAVALLNCVGEKLCAVAASVAAELKVPLIGALSGDAGLDRVRNPYVFRLRADHVREVESLAQQLKQMAVFNVAIVSEQSAPPERRRLMQEALGRAGIKHTVLMLDGTPSLGMESVLAQIKRGGHHALLTDLALGSTERLISQGFGERDELPHVIATTTATGNLVALLGSFKNRAVGFSAVVPNPEATTLALARDLEHDADLYSSGRALTFDGMEAYLAARLTCEALRRTGTGAVQPKQLLNTLNDMGRVDLGGFTVSFEPGRATGSDKVHIGVRSRNGVLLQ